MNAAVIDASVVLRWAFDDEADREGAASVAAALRAGTLAASAPPNFLLEVGAALVVALRTGRITRETLDTVMSAIVAVSIDEVDPHPFAQTVVALALQTGIRVPDAAYLETARRIDATLISADRAQVEAARRLRLAVVSTDNMPAWIPDTP
jgi:predicted nucleic acid-binding protein